MQDDEKLEGRIKNGLGLGAARLGSVGLFHRPGDVHHRQEHEDEGLDAGGEDHEREDRQGHQQRNQQETTASTMSSPMMLPKSRTERERGRERWLMISIGIISGVSHQTGPMNCLKYLRPWTLTPTMWVITKTTRASETVVLRFAVGDSKPGISPSRFEVRM